MQVRIDYEGKDFAKFNLNYAKYIEKIKSFEDLRKYLKEEGYLKEFELLDLVLDKISFNAYLLRVFISENNYILVEYEFAYRNLNDIFECSFVLCSDEAIIFPEVIF